MNLTPGGKPARAIKHYRIDVAGDDVKLNDDGLPPAALVRAVYKAFVENDANMKQFAPQMAYDGRHMAYMVEPGLPFKGVKTRVFPVPLPDRRKPGEFRNFTIKITEVQTIDLDMVIQLCQGKMQAMDVPEIVLTGLQAINVALRQDPLLRFHQYGGGGNRFFSPTERFAISGGAEVAAGFFASARPSLSGLLLKCAYNRELN